VLGTPALILRRETEWQALVESGIHALAGTTPDEILACAAWALEPAALARARTRGGLQQGASLRIAELVGALVEAGAPALVS
jgi:UDP-N-acetylglucosamine 2-epimerase